VARRGKLSRDGKLYLFSHWSLGGALELVTVCSFLLCLLGSFPAALGQQSQSQPQTPLNGGNRLPDLVSSTSEEPIVAVVGQDAFISCVAKNLQNYTIIWRYTNDANGPAGGTPLDDQQGGSADSAQSEPSEGPRSAPAGVILTAGLQRVSSDSRLSVIQSHDTWLLKISNVRPSDTGTYICHTNSEPRVRALRILSVVKPSAGQTDPSSGKYTILLLV